MSGRDSNGVFYAESYHPIQAGSIDGIDIVPHDNAIHRAFLCSSAGLYDPHGDPKVIGDPYCTVFVGRLSHQTTEETLRKAMSKYGRVKNLRLVRHIVTGASRGYAFVEYETEREMRRAYEDAHNSFIDDSRILVDYNRQQLMPGWIPRRFGGGLGGKKESGQLRFGGRDRPFRAPLKPIPYDDLKRLGIPLPPEGRYMTRFHIPSPPRRRSSHRAREDSPLSQRKSADRQEPHRRRNSTDRYDQGYSSIKPRRSKDRQEIWQRRRSVDRYHQEYSPVKQRISEDREETHWRSPTDTYGRKDSPSRQTRSRDWGKLHSKRRRSTDRGNFSHEDCQHHGEHSHHHKKRSASRDYSS